MVTDSPPAADAPRETRGERAMRASLTAGGLSFLVAAVPAVWGMYAVTSHMQPGRAPGSYDPLFPVLGVICLMDYRALVLPLIATVTVTTYIVAYACCEEE